MAGVIFKSCTKSDTFFILSERLIILSFNMPKIPFNEP